MIRALVVALALLGAAQELAAQSSSPTDSARRARAARRAADSAAGRGAPGGAPLQPAPEGVPGARGSDVVLLREVFTYQRQARRDPFLSLIKSGDLTPSLVDLRVVGIAWDPTGRRSVAVMRDLLTKDQYRVKVGQSLGRMKVAQIHPKSVTFTIDEFGYSRQEVLALTDTTKARTQ